VRDLAQRIELVPLEETPHDAPGVWPAEILIECAGQRHTLRTDPHKGSPPNPFTWEEAVEKFRRYTATVLGGQPAKAIIDAVDGLERGGDMADVAGSLALT